MCASRIMQRMLAWHCLTVALLLFTCKSRWSVAATPSGRARDPFSRDRHVKAELLDVMPGNPGRVSVALEWRSLHNNLDPVYEGTTTEDALGNLETVIGYEAQYSESGTGNWVTLSDDISGLGNGLDSATDLHERQLVFTRADPGETISDGFFRLALAYAGESLLNVEQRTVTPPIPFDASEAQMKAALETLDLILEVQVFRSPATPSEGGVSAGTNAYQWVIVFDRVVTSSPAGEQENGDLPLLTLYTETISAKWSGPGDQVSIQSLRERQRDRVVCSNLCRYQSIILPAGVAYSFRVRAHFATLGWSEWSAASDPLPTPATMVPTAPSAPELVVATSSYIKIQWRSAIRQDTALFPILRYHAQQKCVNEIIWTTISSSVPPSLTQYTALASRPLSPNVSCIFRVAAANANGVGPFSLPSPAYSTLAVAPGRVQNLKVSRESLPIPSILVSWMPPTESGGSKILRYEVQYHAIDSTVWIKGDTIFSIEDESEGQVWNFTGHVSWQSYTQYVVRVRAVNMIGEGDFLVSLPFSTPYKVTRDLQTKKNRRAGKSYNASIVTMSADHQSAANTVDRYYIQGTGNGGINGGDGQNGVVLLFPITLGGERLGERAFFFTSGEQRYKIPGPSGRESTVDDGTITVAEKSRIVAADIYAWGGGGGGGQKQLNSLSSGDDLSFGGGGAFVRAQIAVSQGDWLNIIVGGGGSGSQNQGSPGRGGFNGGGDGGHGDFHGGGGGGASEVQINGESVIVAAGGGGGGATDYCCAHGGGAGGASTADDSVVLAEDGHFPDARSIPLDITASAGTASSVSVLGPRDEYHSINVEGDNRDFVGMPARHQHLDWGFAGPDADYSLLATGGVGANSLKPGIAGQASSFQYSRVGKNVWTTVNNPISRVLELASPLTASWPTSGQKNRGGLGQDGKDAGGGGGGGYYGGGGGGAGIDGAGGGGGSSFVAFSALFHPQAESLSRILRLEKSDQSVSRLTVTPVTSRSLQLSWLFPQYGFQQKLQGLLLEMANRSSSEDFRVVRFLPSLNGQTLTNTTISALEPASTYRFRVTTVLNDGSRYPSIIVTAATPSSPKNEWSRVNGDQDLRSVFGFQEDINAGIRAQDPLPLRRFPSARRGHTLIQLDGYLYLFGGLAKGYPCDQAHKIECVIGAGVSNELWRFDLMINTWIEIAAPAILTSSVLPPGRERHSMVVVGDRMLLFAGMQDRQVNTVTGIMSNPALNDLWELSVTSVTRRTTSSLQNLETNLPISDGMELFTIGYSGLGADMCVMDLTVKLQITHACPHSLRIELLGPGPSTFPQRQMSAMFPFDSQTQDIQWSDHDGFTLGDKRVIPTVPSTRSFSVALQVPESAPDKAKCTPGTQSLSFSSLETTSFEPLSVFHQLSVAGGWTLSVSDTMVDGNQGTLSSWDITFTVAPCVPTFTWTNLTATMAGSVPSPRYAHTAVVYQSSMFVFGGRSGSNGKHLTDLYRMDYAATSRSAQWTQLAALVSATATTDERRFHVGRQIVLTPFDLLTVSKGLRSPRQIAGINRHFDSGIYVGRKSVAMMRDGWQRLDGISVQDADDVTPLPRYWSAITYASSPSGHRIYMFGGQDDANLLEDFWKLDLKLLGEQEPSEIVTKRRQEICDWRIGNSAYYAQEWAASCGATSSVVTSGQAKECNLDSLLLFAWCQQFYQTMLL